MNRLKLLLLPSISSAALGLGLSALVLGGVAWSYIQESQLFYDFLFGAYGLRTILLQGPDQLWSFGNAVSGSSVTYYILVIMCGLLAGLTAYTILESISHLRANAQEVLHKMHHPGNAYRQAVAESFTRLGLRALSLLGWTLYTIIFFALLLPFSIIWVQMGIDNLGMNLPLGVAAIAGSWLLLSLSIHAHTVFARLVWLRPRLFGDQAIEEVQSK